MFFLGCIIDRDIIKTPKGFNVCIELYRFCVFGETGKLSNEIHEFVFQLSDKFDEKSNLLVTSDVQHAS